MRRRLLPALFVVLAAQRAAAAVVPCENGRALAYLCEEVDLVARHHDADPLLLVSIGPDQRPGDGGMRWAPWRLAAAAAGQHERCRNAESHPRGMRDRAPRPRRAPHHAASAGPSSPPPGTSSARMLGTASGAARRSSP